MKIYLSSILSIILLTFSTMSAPAQSRMDRLREDYDSLGNVTGKYLFPKEKGANLRILDINVWEWDGTKATLPEAWKKAGEDCSNEVRSKGFSGIVKAYLPEVVCLQEYSPEMHVEFYPQVSKAGYEGMFYASKSDLTDETAFNIAKIENNYNK